MEREDKGDVNGREREGRGSRESKIINSFNMKDTVREGCRDAMSRREILRRRTRCRTRSRSL